MGGKHRRLLGAADVFTDDTVQGFRDAALELIGLVGDFGLDRLRAEQMRLAERLRRFGGCNDALDIWSAEGIAHAETIPELPADQFVALANRIGRASHDAR
jgi:malonate decarboxylase beta subunit